MQPREENQGWWSDGEVISNLWSLNPVFPPQAHYLSLRFYGNCRSGRLPLQMSPGHLFIHHIKPMIQLFLQSPAKKKERVMTSVFGYIAGIRNIFGVGCCHCTLGYKHRRRRGTESKVLAKELRVQGNSPCWFFSLLRQFLIISVGWELRPFLW